MSTMRYRVNAHAGPDGIDQPGDFGFKTSLQTKYENGVYVGDVITEVQFAQHCPKFGVCLVTVHEGPPVHPIWHWNGNREKPTITPSIGCDAKPRCGKHVTITNGESQP